MNRFPETITRLTCCLLIALAPAAFGQETTTDASPDEVDRNEIRSDIRSEYGPQLEQARAEMAAARSELARAARRMAQIRRELLERQQELHGDAREFEFSIDASRFEGLRELRAREIVLEGFPPRLGVLLGEPGASDAGTVVGLTPGGGAEAAGIKQGDRLVSVNGRMVGENPSVSIREIMSAIEAGTKVPVVVARGQEQLDFDVDTSSLQRDVRVIFDDLNSGGDEFEREVLVLRPDGTQAAIPPVPPLPPFARGFSGLGHDSHLVGNHEGLASYFGTANGVIVLQIDAENAFDLAAGDVVLRLDNEPVQRPVELGRLLLMREPGEQVVIEIMRNGVLTQLEAKIPERSEPLSGLRQIRFRAASPKPPQAPVSPQSL